MLSELFIDEVQLKRDCIPNASQYPFSLEAVRNLTKLKLHSNVTILVGENGSGKSTILEAIAIAYGFNPEGGSKNYNFSTKDTHSQLYKYLRLVKGITHPKDGFFFRAESSYNVASYLEEWHIYEEHLHNMSHGESFFWLFMNRFIGNGLYILDEPEAALSPLSQMSFLSRLHDLEKSNSQFIISTHSPIIMAYPTADILSVENNFTKVEYKETEHYRIMHNFLNNTDKMLRILFED